VNAARTSIGGLSDFRLFCLAFVLTFAGIMTNLAAFQWMQVYLDRIEMNRPSGGYDAGHIRLA
jgi:hypothetical protein